MGYLDLFRLRHTVIVLGLCSLALLVYWGGLYGPFLFDDFANLSALGHFNGVRNWETFQLFVLGNESGPTGRPIAMLSFLINDTNWPSEPWGFKFTNLVLHIINAILLYALTLRIIRISSSDEYNNDAYWIAGLVAAIWLLHPFNVSTVLYPVQRMAILATLFCLAGLLAFIHGRTLLGQSGYKAYAWMSGGIIVGTIFATFSKENGALLPLFALCLEYTVLQKLSISADRRWKLLFLWLPLLLIAAYFAYGLLSGNLPAAYTSRPFNITERALTQPRILIDYMYYWFIPHIGSPGLLTQDFPISKSLFEPMTTLPAILAITGLLVSAAILRSRFPLYSLAILFYFTGHLVESTIIPLEMYYEHRNYLPALLLYLPLIAGLINRIKDLKPRILATFIIVAIPVFLTSVRADIWSNEESLAYHWASMHPGSQRALRHAALVAENHGKYNLAISYIELARHGLPDNVAVELHWLTLTCRVRPVNATEKNNTLKVMQDGYFSFKSFNLISSTVQFTARPECRGVDRDYAYQLIDSLRKNASARKLNGARFQLHTIEGMLKLQDNHPVQAAESFRLSLQEYAHIDGALLQVGLLAEAGHYHLALDHIDFIQANINVEKKKGQLDYAAELERLKNVVAEDLSNSMKQSL